MNYCCAVTLGMSGRPGGLAIVERHEEVEGPKAPDYRWTKTHYVSLRHLDRLGPSLTYPQIGDRLQDYLAYAPLRGATRLVVDAFSGTPTVNYLRSRQLAWLTPILPVAGDASSYEDGITRIPSKALISNFKVQLDTKAVRFSRTLELTQELLGQIEGLAFDMDWRETGELARAVLLAVWFEQYYQPTDPAAAREWALRAMLGGGGY